MRLVRTLRALAVATALTGTVLGGASGAYDYDPKAPTASKITVGLDALMDL